MSVPLLDVQHGEFDVRNLLLQLALGLLAKGEQLDALLERDAPPKTIAEPTAAEAPSRDALLDFAMGLVSLRERLRGSLEQAAQQASVEETPAQPEIAAVATELLR